MTTLTLLSPLICWLAVFVARPRTPLPGGEIQERIYARLLGRQQVLIVLATVATAIMVLAHIISLPQDDDADLRAIREARTACLTAQFKASDALDFGGIMTAPKCYELSAGGVWLVKKQRPDGSWIIIGTVTATPWQMP